ncbi:Gp15 family bacteriophage protein [Bacillus haynesii]|uniref:Gp15 family bacteriophage protein n=1 Tax=Bacillus haynesii TaxID=1925021 RepID=UPI002280B6C4|nr:Gp15 family bacteriophage protein [Bacillus haynesii]MCY8408959.1 bacteriophage Gp15 family protein [Bacillus haynesii]MCY8433492.1 bacteriophage Gp15 family protein [Bacillus haynesii]MCY8557828.1 bacteriophage Gp15 family protein [Bacillus haynesii]
MRLTSYVKDETTLNLNGKIIPLDLSFDNVLRAFELKEDKTFTMLEKIKIWAFMFAENEDALMSLQGHEIIEFVDRVFRKITGEAKTDQKNEEVVFDFHQDASYIYASFKAEYEIDLYEEQGRLNWFKFISLLNGLSDKSKIKEVVGIRAAKIPKRTQYNKEERDRLIQLKKLYALEETEEMRKRRAEILSEKFSAFGDAVAKKVGGKRG